MKNHPIKKTHILLFITIVGIISVLFIGPIAQNQEYHLFADQRTFFTIPYFWNVVSNIPFGIAGIFGIFYCFRGPIKPTDYQLVTPIFVFFVGIFLTGLGSSFYHLNPSNETLFWDRLPMTISFMAFFTIVISEFISVKLAAKLFIPLLISGILSLLYWQITESKGVGDLRFYVLVQFLPIVLITAILILYKNNNGSALYYFILLTYLLAKLFEINDELIFSTNHIISGHPIKHVIAAVAPFLFLIGLSKRKLVLNKKGFLGAQHSINYINQNH